MLDDRGDINYLLLTHTIVGNQSQYLSFSGKGRPSKEVDANDGMLYFLTQHLLYNY